MKRLWWLLRLAFHDWMWDPKSPSPRLRAMSQRLPFYFSDPYWMSNAKIKRLFAEGAPVEITRGPRGGSRPKGRRANRSGTSQSLSVQPPWRVAEQRTWASGTACTIEFAPKKEN